MPKPTDAPPPRKPAFFWWSLANALALCYAVTSWVLCLHVFRHPEIPRNYAILTKLKRIPELTRRTALEAPAGVSADPHTLYKIFFGLNPVQIRALNERLLRNYIQNLDQPLLIHYVEGEYQISQTRSLGPQDFFQPGIAVRAQALVKPDDFTPPSPWPVVIEYLFPTDPKDHENALTWFQEGDIISVRRIPNCAVVVHIAKLESADEPKLCLTVIPVAYGDYEAGDHTFAISPPACLNPAATFPVFGK